MQIRLMQRILAVVRMGPDQIIQLFSQAFVLSSETCSPTHSIDFHLLAEIIKKFSTLMMSDDLCK